MTSVVERQAEIMTILKEVTRLKAEGRAQINKVNDFKNQARTAETEKNPYENAMKSSHSPFST